MGLSEGHGIFQYDLPSKTSILTIIDKAILTSDTKHKIADKYR